MIQKILSLVLIALSFTARAGMKPSIVGGTLAKPTEFTSIVSIQEKGLGHTCGGTLIRPNWVLTAAHCMDTSKVTVVAGVHSQDKLSLGETFTAKKVIRHPQFNKPTSYNNDFALIQLDGNSSAPVMKLNTEEFNLEEGQPAVIARIAGWGDLTPRGAISPTELMTVDVPLVSKARCEVAYPNRITDAMVCAGFDEGGKDACQGDSGGPFITQNTQGEWLLSGIISWGVGCAKPGKFGVYSKVSNALEWIETTIKNTENPPTEKPNEPALDPEISKPIIWLPKPVIHIP